MQKVKFASDEWSRNWPTLFGSTVAVSTGGPLFIYTANLFIKSQEAGLGWSRSELALGMTFAMIASAISMPISGYISDKYGAQKVGVVSVITYALLCLTVAFIPAVLHFYYMALIAVSLLHGFTNAVVFNRPVVSAFIKNRGVAMAIVTSGPAIMLVPLAPILTSVVSTYGWRSGYVALSVVAFLFGLPAALLVAWRARKLAPAKAVQGRAEKWSSSDLRIALKSVTFWKLIVGVALAGIPLGGIMHQLSPMLLERGISATTVGLLVSLFSVALIIGKVGIGVLLDNLYPPAVAATAMLIGSCGVLLFAFMPPSFAIYVAVVFTFGWAIGSVGDIEAFFVARHFGYKAFSLLYGILGMCLTVSLGLGALVFGASYDA